VTWDPGGRGVLTIVGYMGRLCPKGMPFLSSHYVKGGKIAILVYERVTKSAAK